MKYLRKAKQIYLIAAVVALLAGIISPLILPALEADAQSTPSPTGFNNPPFQVYNGPNNSPGNFQTCVARFTTTVVTESLIEDTIRPIPIGGGSRDSWPQTGIPTGYLEQHRNQSVPVIEWVAPASRPSSIANGGYETAGGGNTCSSLPPMVPVATNRWQGPQFYLHWAFGATTVSGYYVATFTSQDDGTSHAEGSFEFIDIAQRCSMDELYGRDRTDRPTRSEFVNQCKRSSSNFVVQGSATGGRSVHLLASWQDAATIKLNWSPPLPPGQFGPAVPVEETYRMPQWREWVSEDDKRWSVYFLWESSARPNQTWSSGGAVDNPVSSLDSNSHPTGEGADNCVPFIAVAQNINLSRPGGIYNIESGDSNSFSNRVSSLGSADAIFFDYAEDCSYIGNSEGSGGQQTISDPSRSRIWFYRSSDHEAIRTVFRSGHGNEQRFIGTYNRVGNTDTGSVAYQGGQACGAEARVTENRGGFDTHSTDWEFFDPCDPRQSRGTVNVSTLGGADGDEEFNDDSLPGDGGAIPDVDDPSRIGCPYDNVLNWIICPFINTALTGIERFGILIDNMLNIGTAEIFDDETQTGGAYRTAWGIFRTFALAFIVIAGLIMIISQATGWEVLSPYFIRKVLPLMIIAAVGITLSWQLMEAAVVISNDLGQGIRNIILSPFQGTFDDLAQLSGGTSFIVLLLTTGAIFGYGLVAVLGFVLVGIISILAAFLLLAFREIAIIFLVITAPLAIALSILPNTRRVWKFWQQAFIGLLLMYVMIMGIIALARVFSVVSASRGGVGQLIGIGVYFASYLALLPIARFAISMAGALPGAVGNLVGQASSRLQAPVRKFSQEQGQRFRRETAAGNTWLGRTRLPQSMGGASVAGAFHRAQNVGQGGLTPTRKGQSQYQTLRREEYNKKAAEALNTEAGQEAAGDDDATELAQQRGMTRNRFLEVMQRSQAQGGYGRSADEARRALYTLERGFGARMGSDQMRTAALRARNTSVTAYSPTRFLQQEADRLQQTNPGMTRQQAEEQAAPAAYQRMVNQMQNEAGEAMADGLASASGVVAWRKSNKSRAEVSAPGFSWQMGELEHAQQAVQAARGQRGYVQGNVGVVGGQGAHSAEAWSQQALYNGDYGALAASPRPETIQNLAPEVRRRLQEAANEHAQTGDDTRLQTELARVKALHRVIGQKSQQNAEMFADMVMGQQYGGLAGQQTTAGQSMEVQDATTGQTRSRSWREVADMYEASPTTATRYHDLQASFYNSYLASQQQGAQQQPVAAAGAAAQNQGAQAAAQGQAGQVPGPGGP